MGSSKLTKRCLRREQQKKIIRSSSNNNKKTHTHTFFCCTFLCRCFARLQREFSAGYTFYGENFAWVPVRFVFIAAHFHHLCLFINSSSDGWHILQGIIIILCFSKGQEVNVTVDFGLHGVDGRTGGHVIINFSGFLTLKD